MLRTALLVSLVAVSLAACGSSGESETPDPPATAPVAAEVRPGSAPAPTGKVLLRVSGGETGRIALDMRGIESLPMAERTIREPFVKRDITFEGVWVKDLLTVTGVADERELVFGALDEYHVTFATHELAAGEALLATRADGRRIPVADGGPIRVVFTGDTDTARNTDNWIWSLNTIRTRP